MCDSVHGNGKNVCALVTPWRTQSQHMYTLFLIKGKIGNIYTYGGLWHRNIMPCFVICLILHSKISMVDYTDDPVVAN